MVGSCDNILNTAATVLERHPDVDAAITLRQAAALIPPLSTKPRTDYATVMRQID